MSPSSTTSLPLLVRRYRGLCPAVRVCVVPYRREETVGQILAVPEQQRDADLPSPAELFEGAVQVAIPVLGSRSRDPTNTTQIRIMKYLPDAMGSRNDWHRIHFNTRHIAPQFGCRNKLACIPMTPGAFGEANGTRLPSSINWCHIQLYRRQSAGEQRERTTR